MSSYNEKKWGRANLAPTALHCGAGSPDPALLICGVLSGQVTRQHRHILLQQRHPPCIGTVLCNQAVEIDAAGEFISVPDYAVIPGFF